LAYCGCRHGQKRPKSNPKKNHVPRVCECFTFISFLPQQATGMKIEIEIEIEIN
jgi:hypothetical protein